MSRSGTGAAAALLRAHARYWPTVAPEVHRQLHRWRTAARAIPEPALRHTALRKLHDERFNAEVAATLATLAPPSRRHLVATALVALQVAYDYLDLLTETPLAPERRERTMLVLLDAVAPADGEHAERVPPHDTLADDGEYLASLLATVKASLDALPAAEAVRATAQLSALRCARAQTLRHAVESTRAGAPGARAAQTTTTAAAAAAAAASDNSQQQQLWRWAAAEADATGLRPLELAAGASASVLCLHALIAAAADPATSAREAQRLDALYLSIAALTLLDSLIDAEQDGPPTGSLDVSRELSPHELAARLATVARRASDQASGVAHSGHHRLTLAGVIAYYASAPAAASEPARAVFAELERELHGLTAPALWTMRAWRTAKSRRLVSSACASIALRRPRSRVCAGSGGRATGVGLQTPPEGRR